ncbi:hypothetical protein GCM10007420_22110 [Glycocaulis albus]|uniref:Uncharacterized protein n=1 Tax=Glycocaulis albus TaxID=1382801 RepID=A0ABQ1XW62_9PROT|nr:hypothetical protein GCM10007420_22110 [Glycocaulis albus]
MADIVTTDKPGAGEFENVVHPRSVLSHQASQLRAIGGEGSFRLVKLGLILVRVNGMQAQRGCMGSE